MIFKTTRTIGIMLLVWAVLFGCDKAPSAVCCWRT